MLPSAGIDVPVLPKIHLVAIVSPWVGSTIYHTFMDHRAGQHLYDNLLRVDMLGIWIAQAFGGLIEVYTLLSCLSVGWCCFWLGVYGAISIYCLYKGITARTLWDRRLCFVGPCIMRILSLFLRFISWGGGHPNAFRHMLAHDLLAVLGGVAGATKLPEKWFPGKFDLVGNSHNIMHIVAVASVYHLHQGAVLDLVWLSNQ